MAIIYEPAGKAREYSELAVNLYTGCLHKCKYCYCPAIMRKSLNNWSSNPHPRKNILKLLEKDCIKATNEQKNKELLLSFMSDCYQSDESAALTRQALLMLESYEFKKVNVLTKAGCRAADDFDILSRNTEWKFGSTIIFRSEKLKDEWEAGSPTILSRYNAVKRAHSLGIYTWISIEPVVDVKESLQVIRDLYDYTNFFKVGKLNHFKEIEAKIDWRKFYYEVTTLLKDKPHLIKKDLLKYK